MRWFSLRPVKCLEGWSDMSMNEEGMVVVGGCTWTRRVRDAAIYDQADPVPKPIQDCLGGALGSVVWPLPE